ncbi:MAG: hypothetical protein ACR2NP_17035, partial [Pirellulaceae bacterium]
MNPAKPLLALVIALSSIQLGHAQSAVLHSDYLHDFRIDVQYNPPCHIMVITKTTVAADPLDLLSGREPMEGSVHSIRSFASDADADAWVSGLGSSTVIVDRFAYHPPDTPWIVVGLTGTWAQ